MSNLILLLAEPFPLLLITIIINSKRTRENLPKVILNIPLRNILPDLIQGVPLNISIKRYFDHITIVCGKGVPPLVFFLNNFKTLELFQLHGCEEILPTFFYA